MSIKLMSLVWDCKKFDGSKLNLLLALADFANDDGYCWPSIPVIADKIRKTERQTTRLLQQLESAGFISVIESGNGRGVKSIYRLETAIITKIKDDIQGKLTKIKDDIQGKKDDIQGKKDDIQRAKRVTSSATTLYIDPSSDPSLDPSLDPSSSIRSTNDDDDDESINLSLSPHFLVSKDIAETMPEWTGAETFMRTLDEGQLIALTSWLYLWFLGKYPEEMSKYKRWPLAGVENVVGKIITQARAGNVAPLNEEHRELLSGELKERMGL